MAWVERSGAKSWRVRFRRDDDTIPSVPGFPTKAAAQAYAADMESDQRRGSWIDPSAGKITVGEWLTDWFAALDVAEATEDYYRSLITIHLRPRWGDTELGEVSGLKVADWAEQLRATGYADRTVAGMVKLLTMVLADAADERLIAANPIRPRRRGRHRRTPESSGPPQTRPSPTPPSCS